MSVIIIDSVKIVAFTNGILRIDCIEAGPNAEERASGTLLIPGNQAGQVLQALVKATQELDKRMREQQAGKAQAAPAPATAEALIPDHRRDRSSDFLLGRLDVQAFGSFTRGPQGERYDEARDVLPIG